MQIKSQISEKGSVHDQPNKKKQKFWISFIPKSGMSGCYSESLGVP